MVGPTMVPMTHREAWKFNSVTLVFIMADCIEELISRVFFPPCSHSARFTPEITIHKMSLFKHCLAH